MVDVIFYEKPGCITNSKQKEILKKAGHQVQVKNLLEEPWTVAKLLAFFSHLPVNAWFNQSAPAIKSGHVNPERLSAEQAVNYMLADPLLIRRPLMEVGETKIVGFEQERLNEIFNISPKQNDNIEICSREHNQSPCELKR